MALIVEDGTVVLGAESYVSAADADTYWSNRTVASSWLPLAVSVKEGALREAVQYLDMSYNWRGGRANYNQNLYWPRVLWWAEDNQVVSPHQIPQPIKNAQMELGLIAANGRLIPVQKRGGLIKSTSVGPVSITYMDGAPGITRYNFVDMLLQDYTFGIRFGGISGSVVRG